MICERNHGRGSEQKLTAKHREVVKQTEQTQRSKRAAEEGSLDKDRQKDRISLSHSRGRGSKLHLQRE